MILQLDPPIPVDTTTHGKGEAHILIDYGPEYHVIWGIGITETREWWWLPNPEVRMRDNPTFGRKS